VTLAVLRNDDFLYQFLYLLHIVGVVVGFGPTFVYPMYGSVAKRLKGAEGLAISEASLTIGSRLQWAIYSVALTGILLVLASDEFYEFDQSWISIAFALYIVALVISLAFHQPNLRRMASIQRELLGGSGGAGGSGGGGGEGGPPPQVAELEERGGRAAAYGGILHLLLAAILIDMVWKPGAPF
jgi:uncharacterized membrane protein